MLYLSAVTYGDTKGIDTMSHSPAPAALPLPAPKATRRPAKAGSPQLRLPGATSVDLRIRCVVLAGVEVRIAGGLFGHSVGAQAHAAMLMGGVVKYEKVVTLADGTEIVEVVS
jgi:hypothetical protein